MIITIMLCHVSDVPYFSADVPRFSANVPCFSANVPRFSLTLILTVLHAVAISFVIRQYSVLCYLACIPHIHVSVCTSALFARSYAICRVSITCYNKNI